MRHRFKTLPSRAEIIDATKRFLLKGGTIKHLPPQEIRKKLAALPNLFLTPYTGNGEEEE